MLIIVSIPRCDPYSFRTEIKQGLRRELSLVIFMVFICYGEKSLAVADMTVLEVWLMHQSLASRPDLNWLIIEELWTFPSFLDSLLDCFVADVARR